jgi:hypothetical protein
MTIQEVNLMEKEFLQCMNYSVSMSPGQFQYWFIRFQEYMEPVWARELGTRKNAPGKIHSARSNHSHFNPPVKQYRKRERALIYPGLDRDVTISDQNFFPNSSTICAFLQ